MPLTIEEKKELLLKDLGEVDESITIFAGEANSAIYDDPAVVSEFERLVKSDKPPVIKIMAGPVLSVKTSGKPESNILKLAKENKIELYFRRYRTKLKHFRIIDQKEIFLETSHPPCEGGLVDETVRQNEELKRAEIRSRRDVFDILINEGDAKRSDNPDNDFLYLTNEETRNLHNSTKEKGIDYDSMSKNELEMLLTSSRD
jgi:hypothetical protein